MEVLDDVDIDTVPILAFVDALTAYLVADFRGRATAPPRQSAAFPAGRIVFTTGGLGDLAGFRAYETFGSAGRQAEQQVVAVWDTGTCQLKGLCVGRRLGAIRTSVLGGIAVDALAPPSAAVCALIGTGLQAETQLLGITALRQLREVRIYSRDDANRAAFCARVAARVPARLAACASPEAAVSGADIVVLATDSVEPVVDPAALADVAHVTTVGPKTAKAHELPLAAMAGRLIVTDSPQQIRDQGQRHLLSRHPRAREVIHLGQVLAEGRGSERRSSLYLSAGLAGTEVVALNAALEYLGR